MKTNPLLDIEFMNSLVEGNEREVYARITVLNQQENPIEYIEGQVTDGNITIDGKSIVRRTCSLTMTANDINIEEFYWGLKNKFILEIGLKNEINKNYPDIIWFKMGLFVITQFNTTQTTNKWTIKIQGKDKMCLLNGDVSGNLFAETDFGTEEYHDLENDTVTYTDVPIKTIVYNIVHEFGGELPQNIIINDLDESGLILLEYLNENPAYLYRLQNSNEYKNIVLDGTIECYYPFLKVLTPEQYSQIPDEYQFLKTVYYHHVESNEYRHNGSKPNELWDKLYNNDEGEWFLGKLEDKYAITYDNLLEDLEFNPKPSIIKFPVIEYNRHGEIISKTPSKQSYVLAKIETGDVPGYSYTDLTYAYGEKDLIGKAGEALTSVLNKIKDMLANFEYFYDINGNFVFQKKTDYITTAWNSISDDDMELYKDSNLDRGEIMFSFIDSKLITSFQNTPKITNLKNDYTVWGSYKVNDKEIPLHMRYAIDAKPTSYQPIRPLKEEINIIIKKGDNILSDTTTYKYYDGPEVEPYNDEYLQRLEIGEVKNGFEVSQITVQTQEGYTQTTTIYPYFATRPYVTEKEIKYLYHNTVMVDDEIFSLSDYEQRFKSQKIYLDFNAFLKAAVQKEVYEAFIEEIIINYPVDWRELIYQMALDYRKCHTFDDFLYYITEANPQYPFGRTGYEQYYIDLEGFWRTLYDPNPEIDYEPILFNEVKEESPFLTDTIAENDEYDNIYIQNGYRKLTFMDANEFLLPTDLYYQFSPEKQGNKPDGIYPFITGDECSLDLDQTYYIHKDGVMKGYQAHKKNDTQYEALNTTSLNNVYIKNMQNFTTLGQIVNSVSDIDITKNNQIFMVLIGGKYDVYIVNNGVSIKIDRIEEDETIYQNFTTFDKASGSDILQKQFTVPLYPNTAPFEQYESNYFKFVDVAFDNLTKREEWYQNSDYTYFIKEPGYQKLQDIVELGSLFKNMYYNSNLKILKQYAIELQDKLNTITLSDYGELNKDQYLIDYSNAIQDYITTSVKYNFIDLNNGFKNELSEIILNHQQTILNTITIFRDGNYDFIQPEYSCLMLILDSLINNIDNLIKNYNELLEDNCSSKIIIIKKIYDYVTNTLKDIANRYNEVKIIKDIMTDIESLESKTLIKIDKLLENYEITFDKMDESELYENGQVELLLKNIRKIRTEIKEVSESEINTIIQKIQYQIEIPVTLMNQFIEDAYLTDKEKNGLILTLSLADYEDLHKFIQTIISSFDGLSRLFESMVSMKEENFRIDNKNELISSICFNRKNGLIFPILENLYNILSNSNSLQYSYLSKYAEDIKNYQESIAIPELDNFGNITGKYLYEKINYYKGTYNYNHEQETGNFWCYDVYNTPQLLVFWFDFLDPNHNDLSKISVPAVGSRTKVITDKNVKAINYTEIPQVIFKRATDDYEIKSGYTYININNNTESFFRTSSRGKSAKERVEELLYNHSYCAENVTIATVPVYHLEPNHHIYIRDDKSNIDGEYIINKLTIPLNFKKTMNITATKAAPYLN